LNVFLLQPWISLKNRFGGIARSKHAQNMLAREPPSTNDRFAAEYFRIHSDPL
jgi:hypothetical protein